MIPTLSMCRDTSVYGHQPDQDQRIDGTVPVWAETTPQGGRAVASTHKPFGFHDLLNMVNPLQHIPLVQNAYRALSGDAIEPESQAMGDTLYGGPIGGAMSIVNILVGAVTGADVQGNMVRLAGGSVAPEVRTATIVTAATLPATSEAVGFPAVPPLAKNPAGLTVASAFDLY